MTRIGFVRRTILSRRGQSAWAPVWALVAIGSAGGLRLALDSWVAGLPFMTFFPALLVATVVLDWRWGVVVLLASAVIANFMFQPPLMAFALGAGDLVATVCFLAFGGLVVAGAETLRRAVIELEERTLREREMNLELQHRVNNNLAVIQALAEQTARHAEAPEAFYPAFRERLLAISEANRVLSQRGWEVAVLPELAAVALKPFRGRGSIDLQGPACRLPMKACVPLVLALHELGTNATKYGALSVADGCVRVRWAIENGRCRLTWREEGGPAVVAPTRRGLGSRLLRAQSGLEAVELTFPAAGVACDIFIDDASAITPDPALL